MTVISGRLRRAASLISFYSEVHPVAKFAGNLKPLKAAYAAAGLETKASLSARFDEIAVRLVMANGVTKETFADRFESILSRVLSAVQLPAEIRVLDVPASTGAASLRSIAQLQERHRVVSYVLGDKHHAVLYDQRRRCVFDEAGSLLQVAFGRFYFRLSRVGILGDSRTPVTTALAFPQGVAAAMVRRRYPFRPADAERLLVVHPEVERLLGQGVFSLREMDIFRPIPGQYDLILSFNLLHRKYFPADAVWAGINNLAAALGEGGLLVAGDESSFIVFRKRTLHSGTSLVVELREGERPLGMEWKP